MWDLPFESLCKPSTLRLPSVSAVVLLQRLCIPLSLVLFFFLFIFLTTISLKCFLSLQIRQRERKEKMPYMVLFKLLSAKIIVLWKQSWSKCLSPENLPCTPAISIAHKSWDWRQQHSLLVAVCPLSSGPDELLKLI